MHEPAPADDNGYWDEDDENGEDFEVKKPKWYEEVSYKDGPITTLPERDVATLKAEATSILRDEAIRHSAKEAKGKFGSDRAWMKTVFEKGTASDKVAAHVVTIQDAPCLSLSSLITLVNMVKVGSKTFVKVIDPLTELFVMDLLPPTRKLLPFHKQPLNRLSEMSSGNAITRRRYLMLWAFEDELKSTYVQFVQALNSIANAGIDENKEKAVSIIYKLLTARPEHEEVLLKNLVNKLGDPIRKVASKAIYNLTQLLRDHEVMKQVVLNEIENLLFRSNIGSKAQYYAICFLSQFRYTINDDELACNVISVYFSFFNACIKKGDIDTRMLAALLMGVNRAYPYSKKKLDKITDHVNTLYKMVHLANYNISLQCLSLLFQISDSTQDRFYSVLYKKLSEFKLATSTHQAMFINLIYRALMKDTNMGRVQTFIKRLLQLSGLMPVPLACGFLYAVSQLIEKRSMLYVIQLKAQQQSAFQDDEEDEDDGEEHYKDVPLEDKESAEVKKEKKPCASWHHTALQTRKSTGKFDANVRNPAFAEGESAVYTELSALTNHFHPTVALFARNILEHDIIKYSGDPLIDFTLVRFLDRFVFKNPKQVNYSAELKGPDPILAQRKYYKPTGAKAMSTTSKYYLEQDEKHIPIDELFLFRYLRHKKELGYNVSKKDSDDDDDSDLESVGSDEFEEMINNMPGFKSNKVDKIDFAENIGDKLSNRRAKKIKGAEPDEEDDGEDDYFDGADEEDGDIDEDNDDDDEAIEDGDDGSGISFDDNEDDDIDLDEIDDDNDVMVFDDSEDEGGNTRKSKKKGSKMNRKNMKIDIKKMFAPAEQFSEMLEEAGSTGYREGTAHSLSNKDKAAVKQLDWEMKRSNNSWNKKRKLTRKSFKGKKKRTR